MPVANPGAGAAVSIPVAEHSLGAAARIAKTMLMNLQAPFFQRGNQLVRPTPGKLKVIDGEHVREYSTIVASPCTVASLIPFLEEAARWTRHTKEGPKRAAVPKEVCQIILDEHGEGFPPLTGFSNAPYLTPGARLVVSPGYDCETGVYLSIHRMAGFSIPEKPDIPDLHESISALKGLLDEFAFVSEVDRSVALSILITPCVRTMMAVAPMHGTRAPYYANGKTYLLELAASIAIGSDLPVVAFRENDTDELEKTLTGIALSGAPLAAIDNVTVALRSALVAQMIERPRLSLRPLGGSPIHEINNQMTVLASGKNLQINSDLVRRTLVCNINMAELTPWAHKFKGDPLKEIRENRAKYLQACLTIARFGATHPMPSDCPPFASFGTWNKVVRSPLLHAGLPDPCACISDITENDEDGEALGTIVSLWRGKLGTGSLSAGRIIEAAVELRNHGNRELFEALMEVASIGQELSPKKLSRWLSGNAGTPTKFGSIKSGGRSGSNIRLWKVGGPS